MKTIYTTETIDRGRKAPNKRVKEIANVRPKY
jgi:hypothetical protein